MSTQPSTVAARVAALCSAFHDGAQILVQIKAKRKGLDISAQELELSIYRAELAVNNQYGVTCQRLGNVFALGDQPASGSIQDITIHVEAEVITRLRDHYERESVVDFSALQDVCDSSQERAMLALMQLQQRIVTSGDSDDLVPPPLKPAYASNCTIPAPLSHIVSAPASSTPDLTLKSRDNGSAIGESSRRPISLALASPRPTITSFAPHMSLRSPSSLSRSSIGSNEIARRKVEAYKPVAASVTKPGFFGIGKRTKVEPVPSPPDNPLVDEYLADALESNTRRLSLITSASTPASSIRELNHTVHDSWQERNSPSTVITHGPSASISSLDSVLSSASLDQNGLGLNPSIQPNRTNNLLPDETNHYAGFCKGAWRQQIGDTKRAMEERVRPGGMYNQAKYWQCKHCRFEGRLVPIDKKKSGYDMRVFKLAEGIQFRWEFMFKSHLFVNKDADANPIRATYGCIFCFCEGRSMPTFTGIHPFMNHLSAEHRARLPTGEVLYRMNCLVGRQAAMGEDFDVNLISPEGQG